MRLVTTTLGVVIALLLFLAMIIWVFAEPAEGHFYAHCQKSKCKVHVVAPFKPRLLRMATCESHQRWHLNGTFDGGLQFSPSTWNATGSHYAYAYEAPPLEQEYRAVIWASKINWNWRSTAGWPVCG